MARPGEAQKAGPPAPARPWPRWLFWAPLAVSLLLAFHAVFLWQAHQRARRDYEKVQAQLQEERQRNTHAKAVLDMINSPTVQRMTLVSAKKLPAPQVKTFYEKTSGHVLLLAGNLEPIPDDKVYELWLMPMSGEAMPAGTFRIESDGSAMMLHSMETEGIEAKSFAITVEPLRGSKTPTLPIRYAPAG